MVARRVRSLVGLSIVLAAGTASAQRPAPRAEGAPSAPVAPPPTADDSGRRWADEDPKDAADPKVVFESESREPVSTSGTALVPLEPARDEAPTEGATAPRCGGECARIRALEERVRALEERESFLRSFRLTGFVQPQLVVPIYAGAASPNATSGALPEGVSSNDVTALPDGSTTNGTMFRLRRTRLRLAFEKPYMRAVVQAELVPGLSGTPDGATLIRDAEATALARLSRGARLEVGSGLFMVPFGYEPTESSRQRLFIERAWGWNQMLPGVRDMGVRASLTAYRRRLQVDAAVINGVTVGQGHFLPQPDRNRAKDVVVRVRYGGRVVDGSLSGYVGTGEVVDPALLAVKHVPRRAFGLAIVLHHPFVRRLGETRVVGELVVGTNMDRGLQYGFAVPVVPPGFFGDVRDLHQRLANLRVEQELGRRVTAGARYDSYTPDSSIKNNGRDQYSILAALHLGPHLRLMSEATYAIDNAHARGATAPSKHSVVFSEVLQAMF